MGVSTWLRASERDRLRAIERLKHGYLEGRLSTGTFEARVALAQTATSTATLRSLLADLRARWPGSDLLEGLRLGSRAHDPPALLGTVLLSRSPENLILVGRSRSCDLKLETPGVSRRHALLQRTARRWYITDLDSTNGTFVNGVQIDRAPIPSGSRLRLGDARLYVA